VEFPRKGYVGLCKRVKKVELLRFVSNLSFLYGGTFCTVVEGKVGSSRNHPTRRLLTTGVLPMTGLSLGRNSTTFHDETSLLLKQEYP
jgi:hypothetical protein